MEKPEARWEVYCKPYLNPLDHAIKMIAMTFAAVLAREHVDNSNDAAIFAHCLAIAREEVRKLANFFWNPSQGPRMISNIKVGTNITTLAYSFEGNKFKVEVIDSPLKHKL